MNKPLIALARQPMLQRPVRILMRAHDLCSELRLNVSTRGIVHGDASRARHGDANPYEGTPYHVLTAIFRRLPLEPSEVFADYGCGKGRVVCYAARQGFGRVIGLELDPELAQQARDNAARMRRRRTPVEILETDVSRFDCRAVTIFFNFNSFGPQTMAAVLERIAVSLRVQPRRILFVLYNPQHSELLHGCGWLRPLPELDFDGPTMLQAPHRSRTEFFTNAGMPPPS